MALSANLGFPRIGINRELKKAVESYWKGEITVEELNKIAASIRMDNWQYQKDSGIDHIPSNDFSFYDDKGLDVIALTGAVPQRYNFKGGEVDIATYFAMARGAQSNGVDVKAMEMSKYFDTNYHYIVPEFYEGQKFSLSSNKIFNEYKEAKSAGIQTRPVILGPVSFLILGKTHQENFNKFDLLPELLSVYEQVLRKLVLEGAKWIQIDEPCLVLDLDENAKKAYKDAYAKLSSASDIKICLATYFGDIKENFSIVKEFNIDALHIDLVRAPNQLDSAIESIKKDTLLSLGVIDGRNIWKNDFAASLELIKNAEQKIGKDRIIIAPSCSLLHSPVCLEDETKLDSDVKSWLAFACQKIIEISVLTKAVNHGEDSVSGPLEENKKSAQAKKTSSKIHNQKVQERMKNITKQMAERNSPFAKRAVIQKEVLGLPLLPTTTIGSFPQTKEVRAARAKFNSKAMNEADYKKFIETETVKCIEFQEKLGLDVLVHGEFERNDMVEYFGEQLSGFAFTINGWVQSYGSRCVKPPIIFGDVNRDKPMTIDWIKFAQSKTKKIMKGMLTGPVTILQWSFVRNDQPRSETCKQIALAIRDEVVDLEKADIKIIQIDEAALREGLPLRKNQWQEYLDWAVESFRITASGVQDKTQIHTHMCYSEFNDIIESIGLMDADVISIETSRSQMELLEAFAKFKYPNEIGPGVYDIHSPRIPNNEEMEELLRLALNNLSAVQLWVNPDCGLKTRGWAEVEPALKVMVEAAKNIRKEIAEGKLAKAS